jgi:hypothetical protein
MKIQTDDVVTIILQNPREKIWGVLREVNQTGVFVRGIDLNIFDDFVRAIANDETFYGLSEQFFPLWRVEKIVRDDANGDVPALGEQFQQRTGKQIIEF